MSDPYDYSQVPYGAPPAVYPGYPPYAAPLPYGGSTSYPAYPYGPPPGGAYPPPLGGAPMSAHDEVRTIFVSGFPADVKDRELNNLMRFLPGYEVGSPRHHCTVSLASNERTKKRDVPSTRSREMKRKNDMGHSKSFCSCLPHDHTRAMLPNHVSPSQYPLCPSDCLSVCQAGQMNWKDGVAQGFALFSSGALARSACDAVTQLK